MHDLFIFTITNISTDGKAWTDVSRLVATTRMKLETDTMLTAFMIMMVSVLICQVMSTD